ncbi:MAG: ion transporter [Candidatus Binatia bacterium]
MNLIDEKLAPAKSPKPTLSLPFLARFVESSGFNNASLALIVFSAAILGFETDRDLYQSNRDFFVLLDRGILAFFTLEIGLRILARLPRPAEYFKDSWNLFDCAIVLVCYLPFSGQYAAVLRLLRVLRTLRLLTHIPRLRLIVETMLRSLSSMGYISMLLGLLFYIYGVIAVFSFGELAPSYFGSLSVAVLTLFQIVTLEGWVEILNELKIEFPLAGPAFLISFIVLGTMIVLNLFIGVIVNSLAEAQSDFRVDDKTLAAEELRASVALLHRRLDEIVVPSRPVHDNQEGLKSPGMTSGKQLDGIVRP